MKNKLVELCRQAHRAYLKEDDAPADFSQYIADHLIANGVIVPPCDIAVVVRCRDCKYSYFNDGWHCSFGRGLIGLTHENQFCSYGVRRKNEQPKAD